MKSMQSEFDRETVEERLKLISGALIAAYRDGNRAFLVKYAAQGGIPPGEVPEGTGKLFMRVIQIYHPDRLNVVMGRIESEIVASAAEGPDKAEGKLSELRKFLSLAEPAARPRARDIAYEAPEEEYGYGSEDPGYGEESWGEEGFGEEDFGDEEEAYESDGAIDVLEAIKRAYLGNLDAFPSPLELEMMEGDLDLSDREIEELDGAEYLKCVSSLNLAGNRIQNLYPLREMKSLEYLDLSGNLIEDADDLACLESLAELDLSENEIEDFAFLERMPSLRCVNVMGNPGAGNRAAFDRLTEAGVLVIR
jgi:Leucine-rich repeat (LRR) protein